MTPWTAAHQAPLSMVFSRQEYWSGLPRPPPGDLPHPGIEPRSPASFASQADSLPLSDQGSPVTSPNRISAMFCPFTQPWGLPGWLHGKESTCNAGVAGDAVSIPELGRSPGRGHGNPLQYSCLENPMNRGAWLATVHRLTQSQTRLK